MPVKNGHALIGISGTVHDLANYLLMWQTKCAVRDYRDCKRGDLSQGVFTEASVASFEATQGLYDLLAGSCFVSLMLS